MEKPIRDDKTVLDSAQLTVQESDPSSVPAERAGVTGETRLLSTADTPSTPLTIPAGGNDATLVSTVVPSEPQVTLDNAAASTNPHATIDFSFDPNAGKKTIRAKTTSAPQLAGYEILGELGRGGMGVVYRARHLGLKRDVALKMLLGGSYASPDQLHRFRAEAEAVAKLQHPHIVQIYDVGEQDGLPYFSLEYVDGAALDKALDGKPQLDHDAALMVETLARAMAYAHDCGIVHRDLKPANVLLTKKGEPKVSDFGLVKRLEDNDSSTTRTGTIMGTPSYMAPEQGRGDKNVGPLADVYALGSILYAMLTGRPPFSGAKPMDTLLQVLNSEPVPPSQLQPRISRDVETICLKCLQKDPARRYSSALGLADDLRRFLNKEPILARPVGRVERAWRWCRRRPLVAGLSALAGTLALVVLVGAPIAAVRIAVERDAAITARDDAKTAQGLAENATILAKENEQKAVLAQQKSDEHARVAAEQRGLALEALGTLVNKVQIQLRETPATQQLKQDLLRTGLEGLRKVAHSAQGSDVADFMMAEAHQRMGDIFQSLAQYDDARQQYEESHVIRLALARSNAGQADAERNLAFSFSKLGDISLLEGNRQLAQKHYVESMKLRQVLAAKFPQFAPIQVDLATSYVTLGNVSEPEEAKSYYAQALKVRQGLAASEKGQARASRERDVWIMYTKLADLSWKQKDFPGAREHYEQALLQAKKLPELAPTSPKAKLDLATSYVNVGNVRLQLGEHESAKMNYSQALELLQPLAEDDPKNLDVQASLALVLARRGDHVEAVKMAKNLESLAPRNFRNLYNVACCYALCAAAVDRADSAEPSSADDAAARQLYADRAIATLRQAADRGLKGTEGVISDADLDAIRSHQDYPTLLENLAASEQIPPTVTSPAQP